MCDKDSLWEGAPFAWGKGLHVCVRRHPEALLGCRALRSMSSQPDQLHATSPQLLCMAWCWRTQTVGQLHQSHLESFGKNAFLCHRSGNSDLQDQE